MYFEFGTYLNDWRKIQREIKESERISPKEYGELLQKRKRKKKKMGGKA